jgi:hypothetical protein
MIPIFVMQGSSEKNGFAEMERAYVFGMAEKAASIVKAKNKT